MGMRSKTLYIATTPSESENSQLKILSTYGTSLKKNKKNNLSRYLCASLILCFVLFCFVFLPIYQTTIIKCYRQRCPWYNHDKISVDRSQNPNTWSTQAQWTASVSTQGLSSMSNLIYILMMKVMNDLTASASSSKPPPLLPPPPPTPRPAT